MKAITTKYFGPGNSKGAYYKAQAHKGKGGSIKMSYNYALNSEENHKLAAAKLAEKLGWKNCILHDAYIEHLDMGVHVIVGERK